VSESKRFATVLERIDGYITKQGYAVLELYGYAWSETDTALVAAIRNQRPDCEVVVKCGLIDRANGIYMPTNKCCVDPLDRDVSKHLNPDFHYVHVKVTPRDQKES
jgi:hypothetical protein